MGEWLTAGSAISQIPPHLSTKWFADRKGLVVSLYFTVFGSSLAISSVVIHKFLAMERQRHSNPRARHRHNFAAPASSRRISSNPLGSSSARRRRGLAGWNLHRRSRPVRVASGFS